MTDERFDTIYSLPAADTSFDRHMPDRLRDVINVKDFGAVGDGITDDSAAIQAAIDYAFTYGATVSVAGATVYIPRGTYYLATSVNFGQVGTGPLDSHGNPTDLNAALYICGAGRDGTILKGNIDDYLVKKPSHGASQIVNIEHFTIWNQSTNGNSGAFYIAQVGAAAVARFKNLRLKGFTGIQLNHDTYNYTVEACLFEAPGSALGTVDMQAANGVGTRSIASASWTAASGLHAAHVTVTTTQPHGFIISGASETGSFDYIWGPVLLNMTPAAQYMPNGYGPQWVYIIATNANTFEYELAANPTGTPLTTSWWWRQPGPLPTSVGIYSQQGYLTSCKAIGFDIGFAMDALGQAVIGCSATQCNVGFQDGQSPPYLTNLGNGATPYLGCVATRCGKGYFGRAAGQTVLAGCVFRDDPDAVAGCGVATPVAISNMVYNGTTTVTVTTSAPHNLEFDTSVRILGANPAGYTPNGTGTQTVEVTVTGASTFTYAKTGAAPGAFVSANWSWPLLLGMSIRTGANCAVKACSIPMSAYYAGFDITGVAEGQIPGTQVGNIVMAISPASTWWFPPDTTAYNGNNTANSGGGGWEFIQCGGRGTVTDVRLPLTYRQYPTPWGNLAAFAAVPGVDQRGEYEPMEYNIVNAGTVAFGATVTGTGSDRYKVRYNGTNWTRVG